MFISLFTLFLLLVKMTSLSIALVYPQLSFLSAERIIALTTSLLFSVPVGHLRHVSRKLLVSSGLWPPQSTVQNRKYSLEIILLTWGNLNNIKSSINPSLSTSPGCLSIVPPSQSPVAVLG